MLLRWWDADSKQLAQVVTRYCLFNWIMPDDNHEDPTHPAHVCTTDTNHLDDHRCRCGASHPLH